MHESEKYCAVPKKLDKIFYIPWLHLYEILECIKLNSNDRKDISGYMESELKGAGEGRFRGDVNVLCIYTSIFGKINLYT